MRLKEKKKKKKKNKYQSRTLLIFVFFFFFFGIKEQECLMTLRSFTLTRPSDWLRPKKRKKKKKEADPVQPCL